MGFISCNAIVNNNSLSLFLWIHTLSASVLLLRNYILLKTVGPCHEMPSSESSDYHYPYLSILRSFRYVLFPPSDANKEGMQRGWSNQGQTNVRN